MTTTTSKSAAQTNPGPLDAQNLGGFPIAPAIAGAVRAMGNGPITEAGAQEHLAPLFSRVLERERLYFANHSLGRPLDQTGEDVREAMDLWYTDMDAAWPAWLLEIERFRAGIAHLIGAPRPDCVVPKTAAGQGLRAVLNAARSPRPNIVATRGEFDSVDVVLKTYHHADRARIAWVEPDGDGLFHADDIIRKISYATDIVVVSQVYFMTGQLLGDLERIIDAAHGAHARVVVDTYHSAGVLPVDMAALGADFAIGGSYKYTRGGAGACWLMIHPRHLDGPRPARTLDTGWFAKKDTFGYHRDDPPVMADGGDAWLESTPPFLTAYQARAGLAFTLALGLERQRVWNLEQQEYLAGRLREAGVPVIARAARGAFLLIPSDNAPGLCSKLASESQLDADARGGHVRLCPDVLTTRAEMDEAAQRIARAMA